MKNQILKSALLLMALCTLQSFNSKPQWFKTGGNPESYDAGIDNTVMRNQKYVSTIKSKEEPINGFGTYVSEMKPGKYAGHRIRMSGYIKSDNANTQGGLWIMTDGSQIAQDNESLSSENTDKKLNTWNNDWSRSEIEIDIPADAINIAYGGFLTGRGQVWFDDITFEIVDKKH